MHPDVANPVFIGGNCRGDVGITAKWLRARRIRFGFHCQFLETKLHSGSLVANVQLHRTSVATDTLGSLSWRISVATCLRPTRTPVNRSRSRSIRLPAKGCCRCNSSICRISAKVAAAIGCFQDGSFPGKMQFGSAWWFNDQKEGIERQVNTLSNMGLLGRFVGMLTDSRSFLSYPRHEYFRRVLCNLLGNDVENGELPDDMELLGGMVKDICFRNAEAYFGINVE